MAVDRARACGAAPRSAVQRARTSMQRRCATHHVRLDLRPHELVDGPDAKELDHEADEHAERKLDGRHHGRVRQRLNRQLVRDDHHRRACGVEHNGEDERPRGCRALTVHTVVPRWLILIDH